MRDKQDAPVDGNQHLAVAPAEHDTLRQKRKPHSGAQRQGKSSVSTASLGQPCGAKVASFSRSSHPSTWPSSRGQSPRRAAASPTYSSAHALEPRQQQSPGVREPRGDTGPDSKPFTGGEGRPTSGVKVLLPPRSTRQRTSSEVACLPASQWVDIRELRQAVGSQGRFVLHNPSASVHSVWPPDVRAASPWSHSFYSDTPPRDSSSQVDRLTQAVGAPGWPAPLAPSNIYAQPHSLFLTAQPVSLRQSQLGVVYYFQPGVGPPQAWAEQTPVSAAAGTSDLPAAESPSRKASSESKRGKRAQAEGQPDSSEDTTITNTPEDATDPSGKTPENPPLPRLIAHVALIQQLMAGLLDDRPSRHLQTLRALMALLAHSRQTLCRWAGMTLGKLHVTLSSSRQSPEEGAERTEGVFPSQESQKAAPVMSNSVETQEHDVLSSGQSPPGLDCLLMSVRVSLLHLVAGDLLTSAEAAVRSCSAECLACLAHLASAIAVLTGPSVFRQALCFATKSGRLRRFLRFSGKVSSQDAVRGGEEVVRCGAHRILQMAEAVRAFKDTKTSCSTLGRDGSGRDHQPPAKQRGEQERLLNECGEWTVQETEACESAGAVVKCCLVLLTHMTADSASVVRLASLSAVLSLIAHITEDLALQSLQRPSFPPTTPNPISRCRVLLRLHLFTSTRAAVSAALEATQRSGLLNDVPLSSAPRALSSPSQNPHLSSASAPFPQLGSSASCGLPLSSAAADEHSPLAAVVSALASAGERAHTAHHTVAGQQLQSEIAKSPLAVGWLLSSLDDSVPQVRALGFVLLRSLLEFYTRTGGDSSSLALRKKQSAEGRGPEDSTTPASHLSFPNAVQLLIWDYLSDPVHAVQASAASALPCLSRSIPLRDGAFRRAIFPLLHARKKRSRLLFLRVLPLCKTFNARALKVEVQGLLRCPYAREDEWDISACLAEIIYAAYHNLWSTEEGQEDEGVRNFVVGEAGQDTEENRIEGKRRGDLSGELERTPDGLRGNRRNGEHAEDRKKEEEMLQVYRVLATPKTRKRTQLTVIADWARRDWELRLLLVMRRRSAGQEEESTRRSGVVLSDGLCLPDDTGGKEESSGTANTNSEAAPFANNQRGDLHGATPRSCDGHTPGSVVGEHLQTGGNKRRRTATPGISECALILEEKKEKDRLSRFLPLDVLLAVQYVALQFPLATDQPLPTFAIERQMEAVDCLLSELDDEGEETAAGVADEASVAPGRHGSTQSEKKAMQPLRKPEFLDCHTSEKSSQEIDATSAWQRGVDADKTCVRERRSFPGLEKLYPLVRRKRPLHAAYEKSSTEPQRRCLSFLHRRSVLSRTTLTSPTESPVAHSTAPPSGGSADSSTPSAPVLLERDTWELLHSDVPCRFGVLRQAVRSMRPVLMFVSSSFFSGNQRRTGHLAAEEAWPHRESSPAEIPDVPSALSRFSSVSSSLPSEEERERSSSSVSSPPAAKRRKQQEETQASGQRDGKQVPGETIASAATPMTKARTSKQVGQRDKSSSLGTARSRLNLETSVSGMRSLGPSKSQEQSKGGEREEYEEQEEHPDRLFRLPLFPCPSLADSLLLFQLKMERRYARKQWLLFHTHALSHAGPTASSSVETAGQKHVYHSSNTRGTEKLSGGKGLSCSSLFSLSSSSKPSPLRSMSARSSLIPQRKVRKKTERNTAGIGASPGATPQLDVGSTRQLKREEGSVLTSVWDPSSLLSSIWPKCKTRLSLFPLHSPTLACNETMTGNTNASNKSWTSLSVSMRGRESSSVGPQRKAGRREEEKERRRRQLEVVQAFTKDGEDLSFSSASRDIRGSGQQEEEEPGAWAETDQHDGDRMMSSWAARFKQIERSKEVSEGDDGTAGAGGARAYRRGCEVAPPSWRQVVDMCLPEESWRSSLFLEKTWQTLRKKKRRKTLLGDTDGRRTSLSMQGRLPGSKLEADPTRSSAAPSSHNKKTQSHFSSFLSVAFSLLAEKARREWGGSTPSSCSSSSLHRSLGQSRESVLPRSFCLWRNELISSRLQALAATALIASPSLVLNPHELLPDRRLLSLQPSSFLFPHVGTGRGGRGGFHVGLLDKCVSSSASIPTTSTEDDGILSSRGDRGGGGEEEEDALSPHERRFFRRLFVFLSASLSFFFVVYLRERHWKRSLGAYMQEGAVAATGLASFSPLVVRKDGKNDNKNSTGQHLDCYYNVKGEKTSSARFLEGRGGLVQEALNDLLPIPIRFGCSKGCVVWLEARLSVPGEQLARIVSPRRPSLSPNTRGKDEKPTGGDQRSPIKGSETENPHPGSFFSTTLKQRKREEEEEGAELAQGELKKKAFLLKGMSVSHSEEEKNRAGLKTLATHQEMLKGQLKRPLHVMPSGWPGEREKDKRNEDTERHVLLEEAENGTAGEPKDLGSIPPEDLDFVGEEYPPLTPTFFLCVRTPVACELPKKRHEERQRANAPFSSEQGLHPRHQERDNSAVDAQQLGGRQPSQSSSLQPEGFECATASVVNSQSSPLVRAVLANFHGNVFSSFSSSFVFSTPPEDDQGAGSPSRTRRLSSAAGLTCSSCLSVPSCSSPQAHSRLAENEESHQSSSSTCIPVLAPSSSALSKDRHSRCSSRRKRKTPWRHPQAELSSGGCGFASRILGLHLRKPQELVESLLSQNSSGASESPSAESCCSSSSSPPCRGPPSSRSTEPSVSSSSLPAPVADVSQGPTSPAGTLKPSVVPLLSPGAELASCLLNYSERRSSWLSRGSGPSSPCRLEEVQSSRECATFEQSPVFWDGPGEEDKETGVRVYRVNLGAAEWPNGSSPQQKEKHAREVRVAFPLSLGAPTSGPFPVDVVVCALFQGHRKRGSFRYISAAPVDHDVCNDRCEGDPLEVPFLVPTSDVKRLWLQPTWFG